jgi:hypothetical protein
MLEDGRTASAAGLVKPRGRQPSECFAEPPFSRYSHPPSQRIPVTIARQMGEFMKITLIVFFYVVGSLATAWAQQKQPINAAEMKLLLANGLAVNSSDLQGGKEFVGRVNLEPGGGISGTLTVVGHGQVALSGRWKLRGAQLCRTIEPIEPNEVCESWLRIGPKRAIIEVGGRETSINNWQ